ncbi:MAG: YaiI/YqxD family protein [Desulfuromonadales bacterium]|nr:YaiI/YqxD family protein [Desulfuromonadales bacterium]
MTTPAKTGDNLPEIYVDADACPVKQEVCKVARRYRLNVILVANARMRVTDPDVARLVVVDGEFNAADDWIVAQVAAGDIVITADIPLASRCVKSGARVLSPTGYEWSDANVGQALATRDLLSELRDAGAMLGGPPPFQPRDRSRFLQNLDQMIQDVKRAR